MPAPPRLSEFAGLAREGDWQPAFQALVGAAAASGADRAHVDYRPVYETRRPIVHPGRLTLEGLPGPNGERPLVRNVATAYEDADCVRLGMMHEALWGRVESWPVVSFVGRVVTFASAGDAARAVATAAGGLLVVAVNDWSEQPGRTARNALAVLMARVLDVDGARVTVDEPAEHVATSWDPSADWGAGPGRHPAGGALELRATALGAGVWRGHGTYVCDRPGLRHLAFDSPRASWCARTAAYRPDVEGVHVVDSDLAFGGNLLVHGRMSGVGGYFRRKAGEAAEGCHGTTWEDCWATLHPGADPERVASSLLVLRGQSTLRRVRVDGGDAEWKVLLLGRQGYGRARDVEVAGRCTATPVLADTSVPQDAGRFDVGRVDIDLMGSATGRYPIRLSAPGATADRMTFRGSTFDTAESRTALVEGPGASATRCRFEGQMRIAEGVAAA